MTTVPNPTEGLEQAAEIYRENILDHYKNPHNRSLLGKGCIEKEAPRTFGARMAFPGGNL